MRLIRYLWAAPATLFGLALTLVAIGVGARARIVDGVLEVAGGGLGRARRMVPFHAITFGHVVLGIDPAALRRLRAHEHVHVRQYERWGALFVVLYLSSSLFELLRGRDVYRDNRFEREAFARSQHTDVGQTTTSALVGDDHRLNLALPSRPMQAKRRRGRRRPQEARCRASRRFRS